MSFLKEYTLLGELGKGGFAKVYKVRHNELGYIRAIRVLNESITDERSKTYQKFLHECKVLLRLGNGNHRNIVHIYQPRLLDNHALVEMDYVDGRDITHYLKENGNYLPVEEVLRMVEEMSNALAYCHEDIYQFCMNPDEDDLQNDPIDGSKWLIDEPTKERLVEKYKVIHNDIHSGNIMRRRDGSFVLLDFGLAIEGDEVVKSSSRHENGAPEYMPPEKWDNETVLTEQSDVYSFGVVMYEYLAGRVPFVCEGNSFNARTKLYDKIKNSTSLPSILDLRKSFFEEKHKGEAYKKDYPDWLETAILKCLEKDPAKRFRNGKELNEYVTKHLQDDAITKESVQQLSDENIALIKEKQHALAQIADLSKKNDDLAHLADSTSRELEQARMQLANLQNDNDDRLNQQLSGLQIRIKQKDDEIHNLRKDVAELENQVAKSGGSNSNLQKRIDYLQVKCDSLESQLEQTSKEKEKLQDEIEVLKANQGAKTKPVPIILCVLFGIAAAVLGILYLADPPNDYINNIKRENVELKNNNEELTEQVANLEQSNQELAVQLDDMRNNANPLPNTINNNELNSARNKIKELENQITQLNEEISRLNNRPVQPVRVPSNCVPSNTSDNSDELNSARIRISELEYQVASLNREINSLREENSTLQRGLDAALREIGNK